MKKYIFVLPIVMSLLLGGGYALAAADGCCVGTPCGCVKGGCCVYGKCSCRGECCTKGNCQCAGAKCTAKCDCQK